VTAPAQRPIEYKGEPLDADRGPGLGCFRFQVGVLIAFIILTPLTVAWDWPTWISVGLLVAVIVLLLVAGQTIIFLLRLVAADRRTRRRPLGSATKTVGEMEDEGSAGAPDAAPEAPATGDSEVAPDTTADDASESPNDEGPVRQ
jgi:hypothetical protein